MKRKLCVLLSLLLVGGMLLMPSCGAKKPTGDDRETFPEESYAIVGDADVQFRDGLDSAAYSPDSTVGKWLVGCAAPDRDEYFDVYSLRHDTAKGRLTTFTYIIYYPHGGESVTASCEVLEREGGGYVVNLTYTPGGSSDGYALTYLSVTLPTETAPRLRLLYEGKLLGQMATVTDEEI